MATERMIFIGVSTGGSSMMALFPRWAEMLGFDAQLEGYDIPLGAPPEAFRAPIEHIVGSDNVRGGLVTTHKLGIYRHAGDLFEDFDDDARLCSEISCISKHNGRIVGHAKDPITAAMTLDEMLGRDHRAMSAGHVLCLGAGGAGVAIALCLMRWEQPPARILLTDLDEARLEAAAVAHRSVTTRATLEYRVGSQLESGRLLSELPPGSLIINEPGWARIGPDHRPRPMHPGLTAAS